MRPIHIKEMNLEVMGVPIKVTGAIYYPAEPETRIDPPEAEFAEWDRVFIGDIDVSELFAVRHNAEELHEAILRECE